MHTTCVAHTKNIIRTRIRQWPHANDSVISHWVGRQRFDSSSYHFKGKFPIRTRIKIALLHFGWNLSCDKLALKKFGNVVCCAMRMAELPASDYSPRTNAKL